MSAISVRNLVYDVSGRRVLDGVNLDIEKGEIVSVMGMSGSGKTTLLKLMTGLLRPTSGEIEIAGTELTHLNEVELDRVRLKIGLVFQYAALFDSLNVYDNIVFGVVRHRKRVRREELDELVDRLLAQVQLHGVEHQYPSELSGGMQKRVGLARALAMEPDIIFYDEPTSGLDPVTGGHIDRLIVDVRDSTGVTSVVVSHHLPSIFAISNRIAMLDGGKIVFLGTPEQARTSHNPVVDRFVSPERQMVLRI